MIGLRGVLVLLPIAPRITDQLAYSVLVNIWNHTSFPAYKSRLWNMAGSPEDSSVEKRKP